MSLDSILYGVSDLPKAPAPLRGHGRLRSRVNVRATTTTTTTTAGDLAAVLLLCS